ncbi:MAG: ABC transporter ATP-binding protein, partial [Planctomycetes bacterium]|nr:ABC transporter ATP-binding protein [Planctomycetota bacterium]
FIEYMTVDAVERTSSPMYPLWDHNLFDAYLRRFGLGRNKKIKDLSRGMQMKLMLAVALSHDAKLLILDEPTSGLDPLQRKEVRSLIGALAQDHTVLLSSHILAEIELICPRVIILDRGKLLADGTQRQLLHQLAGDQRIRLEAMCGSDVEAARRSLAALPGVASVVVGERVGIHQAFELRGEGDLREDVGALAMQKGWALRELSLTRATLEEVFSKLVLGELGTAASPALAPAPPAAQSGTQSAPTNLLQLALPDAKVPSEPASKPGGAIYSLNPFDRGASRDLSKPVPRDPEPPSDPEGCDQ